MAPKKQWGSAPQESTTANRPGWGLSPQESTTAAKPGWGSAPQESTTSGGKWGSAPQESTTGAPKPMTGVKPNCPVYSVYVLDGLHFTVNRVISDQSGEAIIFDVEHEGQP